MHMWEVKIVTIEAWPWNTVVVLFRDASVRVPIVYLWHVWSLLGQ